jgi:hypothetical protein
MEDTAWIEVYKNSLMGVNTPRDNRMHLLPKLFSLFCSAPDLGSIRYCYCPVIISLHKRHKFFFLNGYTTVTGSL